MGTSTVVVVDSSGIIRMWDAAAEELFGHDAASVVGESLDSLVPAEYRARHWAGFNALMAATGDSEPDRGAVSVPVRCVDGALRRCAVRLILLLDPWGRAAGAAAVFSAAEPAGEDSSLPQL